MASLSQQCQIWGLNEVNIYLCLVATLLRSLPNIITDYDRNLTYDELGVIMSMVRVSLPVNTKYLYNISTTLVQRQIRCT